MKCPFRTITEHWKYAVRPGFTTFMEWQSCKLEEAHRTETEFADCYKHKCPAYRVSFPANHPKKKIYECLKLEVNNAN
jgi:hypothetical protein